MKRLITITAFWIIGILGIAAMLFIIINEVFSLLRAVSFTILSLIGILRIQYMLLVKNQDLEFLILSSIVSTIFFAIIGLNYSPAIGVFLLFSATISIFSIYMAVENFVKPTGKVKEVNEIENK